MNSVMTGKKKQSESNNLASIVQPNRCTISQVYFILEQHSTYFGRSLHPSSGV